MNLFTYEIIADPRSVKFCSLVSFQIFTYVGWICALRLSHENDATRIDFQKYKKVSHVEFIYFKILLL